MSFTVNYVQGIQDFMIQNGMVQYANEKIAAVDAAAMGEGVDKAVPVDEGALATQGAAPEGTHIIAAALHEMAQQVGQEAQVNQAKAAIIQNAMTQIAGNPGAMPTKTAEEVAGGSPGHVAAGESNSKKTDHNKDLVNAIMTNVHRPNYFSPVPGKTRLHAPMVGKEGPLPGAPKGGEGNKKAHRDLVNAITTNLKRPNYMGAPGHQAQENQGCVGEEKAASLSDWLARV